MVVEIIEQIIEGNIIPVGLELPADASMPIIDVGKSCMLEQDIAINIIIGKDTTDLFGLSFCIDSIAFMPSGVAAPFIPNKFADIFIDTYLLLSCERLLLPNILFIIGDSNLESFSESPHFSNIEKSPSHIAYIAQSSNDSLTALFEAVKRLDKTFVGSPKHSEIMLIINIIIQIRFILKNMIEIIEIWG